VNGRPAGTATTIAGRAREREAIAAVLARVTAGEGAVLSLAGPAGIGKSRLLHECDRLATAAGWEVISAHCYPEDTPVPFAPFASLQARGEAGAQLRAAVGVAAETLRDVALAAAEAVEATSRQRPICFLVEDLHWADDGTLALILRLARRVTVLPILLVVTYRSDEIGPALADFLASVVRETGWQELELTALNTEEVATLTQTLLGSAQPPRREFARELHELTDGNPLFVVEILKALTAGGDLDPLRPDWDRHPLSRMEPPRLLQHAVQRQLRMLSESTRTLLTVAAAVGRTFDIALMCRLLSLSEHDAFTQLREASTRRVLTETADGAFQFSHALTRETVYAGLLVRERELLHQQIAGALVEAGDAAAADLARHFAAAGQWEAARLAALEAAEAAHAMGTQRAVRHHLDQAAEAARHLGIDLDGVHLRWRAEAAETLGEFELARADFEAALVAAQTNGEAREEWELTRALGMLWSGRDYARGLPWYEQMARVADTIADPVLRARSLNHVGNWHCNAGDLAEARRLHEAALSIAETCADRAVIAETLDFLAMVEGMDGRFIAAGAWMERAIPLYEAVGDERGLASLLASYATIEGGLPDSYVCAFPPATEATRSAGARALELARHLDWHSGESYVLSCIGGAEAAHGRFDPARERAVRALQLAREIEHDQWATAALLALGFVDQAQQLPDRGRARYLEAVELAQRVGSRYWIDIAQGALAYSALDRGDADDAARWLATLEGGGGARTGVPGRLLALGNAELLLLCGEHAQALFAIEQLTATLEDPAIDVPFLMHRQAWGLAGLGRTDEAVADFQNAIAAAEGRNWWVQALAAREALAATLEHASDAGAASAREAARSLRRRLASSIADPLARAAYLGKASEPIASHGPASTVGVAGLSRREVEVLRLIGRGLSNAEIAEQLVIEKRTVETHVAHIFRKTTVASRAQAIRWALAHRIVE
jgi:DNA-binding NarL/FixJ family response regulator